MPIKEVPMYRATCDTCGDGNHESEYWAWAEADQARSEWDDDGYGVALDDGRLFCGKCIPADVCRLSDGDGKHSPSDDGLSCVECERELVVPSKFPEAVRTGRIGAHISWARTTDRSARTAPARAAFEAKFLAEADGDPVRAEHLRKAHFARLALASARARRRKSVRPRTDSGDAA